MSVSSLLLNSPRCAGRNLLTKNLINELPDDILMYVLSFLTTKEAGRTSVLSKRWKHVWEYITTLDLEGGNIIKEVVLRNKFIEVEEPKYFNWVDRVISSLKSPTIDEFRVHFDIDLESNETSRNRIDNWLRFAIEKRVKMLEINFYMYKGPHRLLRYTFPSFYCNSLTSLELGCVDVTGEILESFLCGCVDLEYLTVKHSESLVELKVDGPMLKLKSLTIFRCWNVEKLEISAPNLASICYVGPKINVQIKSTPKLTQVSIGFDYAEDLIDSFSDFSRYISQIEVLGLSPICGIWEMRISDDLVFTRLRKLEYTVVPHLDEDISFFRSLIKACPFLYHFKLMFIFIIGPPSTNKELIKPRPFRHYHLKIVEIVGFVGHQIDIQIAAFLLESAVSLDKITVDPREVLEIGMPWEYELIREIRRARMRANQLRRNVKPPTLLEVL